MNSSDRSTMNTVFCFCPLCCVNYLGTEVGFKTQKHSQRNANQVVAPYIHICDECLPSTSNSHPFKTNKFIRIKIYFLLLTITVHRIRSEQWWLQCRWYEVPSSSRRAFFYWVCEHFSCFTARFCSEKTSLISWCFYIDVANEEVFQHLHMVRKILRIAC